VGEQLMRMQDFGPAYIGGQWQSSERQFAVVNPATGEALASVADLSRPQIEAAVEAASQAFAPWSGKTAHERAAILKRWSALIMANQEALAQIMTAEQGKPLAEARGEPGLVRPLYAARGEGRGGSAGGSGEEGEAAHGVPRIGEG